MSTRELKPLQPKGFLFLARQMGHYGHALQIGLTVLPPLQPISEYGYASGRFKLRQCLVIIVQYGILAGPLIPEDAKFGLHIGLIVRISIQVVRGDI